MIIQNKSWEFYPINVEYFESQSMQFLHRFFGYHGKVKNPNAGSFHISTIIEIVKVDQALLEVTHTLHWLRREEKLIQRPLITGLLLDHGGLILTLLISGIQALGFMIALSFYMIRSDQISHSVMFDSLRPHEPQHSRPPCPSPTPGVH